MGRILLFTTVILISLSSCGRRTSGNLSSSGSKRMEVPKIEHPLLGKAPASIVETDTTAEKVIKSTHDLNSFINEWKGTPHRMGGNSKQGIDCSGLVCMAYRDIYALEFKGRSAADIFEEVRAIDKSDLKEGDLVFFKINRGRIDHVGIYLRNGDFLHTSSSRGVMISNLEEEYYRKRFFKGGRRKNWREL